MRAFPRGSLSLFTIRETCARIEKTNPQNGLLGFPPEFPLFLLWVVDVPTAGFYRHPSWFKGTTNLYVGQLAEWLKAPDSKSGRRR